MTTRAGTETEMANAALRLCKEPPVAAITENVHRARVCRAAFPDVRDALLRRKDWNFATHWFTPAESATASAGPLTHRFILPADILRVRFVDGLSADEWAIEEAAAPGETAVLVTNAAAPLVCATRRIESPALWDALFSQAFAAALAAAVAPSIARDSGLAETLSGMAEAYLAQAARIDAKEKAISSLPVNTSWLVARR